MPESNGIREREQNSAGGAPAQITISLTRLSAVPAMHTSYNSCHYEDTSWQPPQVEQNITFSITLTLMLWATPSW